MCSRLQVVLTALAGLAGFLGMWFAIGASPAVAAPPTAAGAELTCVQFKTEARYSGLGYNHLVNLTNTCQVAANCNVTTNVNKEPIAVTLAPGEKQTVVTWQGSPASAFTATVVCRAR